MYYHGGTGERLPIRTLLTCGAKVDPQASYDDFEVERVVQVELNPKSAAERSCLGPRTCRQPSAACCTAATTTRTPLTPADSVGQNDAKVAAEAQDELNALGAVQAMNMAGYQACNAFLAQYSTTAARRSRALIDLLQRLLPLLEF